MGTLLVRHDASSAALVRQEIAADLLARSITADSVNDVILVATELVGNAVVHAKDVDDLDVAWDVHGSDVTVRVYDRSELLPKPRTAGVHATNGRGLAIVAAIAEEWGVRQTRPGKQVWARIAVTLVI